MTTTAKTTIKTQTRRKKTAPAATPPRLKRATKRVASISAEAVAGPVIAAPSADDQSIAKRPAKPPVPEPSTAKPGPGGKLGLVVALLRRPEGATVAQLSDATDWLPHSVRGAIAGALKKKHKLPVLSEQAEGGRVYRLAPERSVSQGGEQSADQGVPA